MVWNVRLLSEPKFALSLRGHAPPARGPVTQHAVLTTSFPLTLATDLSDAFYPAPAVFHVQLLAVDRDGHEFKYGPEHTLPWKGAQAKTRAVKAQLQQEVRLQGDSLAGPDGNATTTQAIAIHVYVVLPCPRRSGRNEAPIVPDGSVPEFLDAWTVPLSLNLAQLKMTTATGTKAINVPATYGGDYWLQRRIPILPELVEVEDTQEEEPSGHDQTAPEELNGNTPDQRVPSAEEATAMPLPAIKLLEEAGESIARHVWDGGVAMVYEIMRLLRNARTMPDSTPPPGSLSAILQDLSDSTRSTTPGILELGAGCGTVGVALAKLLPASRVLLTDLPEALEIMSANTQALALPKDSATMVEIMELDWLDLLADVTHKASQVRSSALGDDLDLIVVSECTYNEDTLGLLVDALTLLTSLYTRKESGSPAVVVARKTRHDSEEAFFNMMEDHFVRTQEVSVRLPDRVKASQEAEVNIHVYRRR